MLLIGSTHEAQNIKMLKTLFQGFPAGVTIGKYKIQTMHLFQMILNNAFIQIMWCLEEVHVRACL